MSQARWTWHFARIACLALRGKSRVRLAWHSSACYAGYGPQRIITLALFIWRFLCNDRNCRIAVSHSLCIFYPFYVYTFSFSVYVLFVCILFAHFFLVYVSSVHFLLYKHTGAGGVLSYKSTRILFYGRDPNSFPPLRGINQTTTNYIKVPRQLWQQSPVLGFSTLRGTNPQI